MPPTPDAFLRDCCAAVGVTLSDVRGTTRDDALHVLARQAVSWACRTRAVRADGTARWSYPELGRALRRDHTTVLYSVRKFARRLASREPGAVAMSQALASVGEQVPGLQTALDTLLEMCGAPEPLP